MASVVRNRLASVLRSPRVRTVLLLYCGYEAYSFGKNQNTLYKTFSARHHRPGETVLDLDLDGVQIVSRESRSVLKSVEEIKLQSLIHALQSAREDPRVTGLVVRGFSGLRSLGLAEVCELRAAINSFSQGWGGKHAMFHVAEGLGSTGNGTIPLYFASAFDSIHVQPTSGITIPGLSLATLFFKRMLENIGLKAKKVARKEFKTAANTFTEEKFTDPHRETTESLLSAIMKGVVEGIAQGRGISEKQVRNAIDVGVMSASEARDFGLVDDALYRDELPSFMQERLLESRERRSAARTHAEKEWHNAMKDLKTAWESNNGWRQLWDNGNFIRYLSTAQIAVPKSTVTKDGHDSDTNTALAAEIRALKAHAAWLDTCPWEGVCDGQEGLDSVYYAIPHISLLMATERQLCNNAVRVLEELPKLLESCIGEDEEVVTLDKKQFLPIVRWCRSMWRAKCLVARIVSTLADTEEYISQNVRNANETAIDEDEGSVVFEPHLFLVGYADEYPIGMRRSETSSESSSDNNEVNKTLEAKPRAKAPMRHVRFSDYMDTVTAEKRATLDRAGRRVGRNASGAIDRHERRALQQLQLPGRRIVPWKMNTISSNIIAVINIDGPISDEKADVTRAAIRRADKDPNVKAIVLRIESPGGSATASDLISRAVEVAKKPVVASMGSVCASGGYFIAAPCDKIFASAMTITGSIGVIFQTFNTSGLFEKLGITADSCESGRFAKYYGPMAPITEWSDEFAARVDKMIDSFYADFVKAVAKGRNMTFDNVEIVARGRVWAGSDALHNGLVDQIGGMQEAVDAATDLALLAPDSEVRAIEYPTIAMQVQDAARRRGLIPSNLDEEGDEIVPVKRRRSGLWNRSKDATDPDTPEGSPGSQREGLLDTSSRLFDDVLKTALSRILLRADGLLFSDTMPLSARYALEGLLYRLLHFVGEGRKYDAIVDEFEMGLATSGRPAHVAPNFRVE